MHNGPALIHKNAEADRIDKNNKSLPYKLVLALK